MLAGIAQHRAGFARIGKRCRLRAEIGRQLQGAQDAAPPRFGQAIQPRGFDIHRVPGAVEPRRQPRRASHQLFAAAVVADAQQDSIARVPHFLAPLGVTPGTHLVVDAVGSAAQCQLAQRNQVALAEKVFDGAFGPFANVNLALFQPLTQVVRRQVHQHHFIGGIEKRVRHGFAGHAADHVVEAFQMLHVDGGHHVDAGIQQLVDILPAFGMARATGVAVRQLIHQDHRRMTGQGSIKIELRVAMLAGGATRQQRQAVKQLRRFGPVMGLHHADQHLQPLRAQAPCLLQHREGFPHPGAGAKVDLQLAAPAVRRLAQQRVRVRALEFVVHWFP